MDDGAHSFASARRLSTAADYGRVFRRAARSRDRYFTVLARENTHGAPRLGLAISRKCARRAVDRNRIKRVVRESFRRAAPQLAAVDFVVMGQAGVAAAPNPALFESLARHWPRAAAAASGARGDGGRRSRRG